MLQALDDRHHVLLSLCSALVEKSGDLHVGLTVEVLEG